jgi:hypothetical protein
MLRHRRRRELWFNRWLRLSRLGVLDSRRREPKLGVWRLFVFWRYIWLFWHRRRWHRVMHRLQSSVYDGFAALFMWKDEWMLQRRWRLLWCSFNLWLHLSRFLWRLWIWFRSNWKHRLHLLLWSNIRSQPSEWGWNWRMCKDPKEWMLWNRGRWSVNRWLHLSRILWRLWICRVSNWK